MNRRKSIVCAVVGVVLLTSILVHRAYVFRSETGTVTVFEVRNGHRCALGLLDWERPCSVTLALGLAKLGFARWEESRYILFDEDYRWTQDDRPASMDGYTCRQQTVLHIGNLDTTFLLSDERDYYVRPRSRESIDRTLSNLGIREGTLVNLCDRHGLPVLDLAGKGKHIMRLW